MGTKLTNNATGRLAVSLTAASTQLSMVVGDAVKFPTIAEGSGDNFPLTAVKANGELEIMLCTLTNGNVFTVQRGQEGTSPKAFSAGDRIELRLTAGTIDGMIDDRIEVVLEDLGTAAYADLTTSPLDTTAGRALKVGDFGLGTTTPPELQRKNDYAQSVAQFFTVSGADVPTAWGQDGASTGGVIMPRGNRPVALYFGNNNKLKISHFDGSSWSDGAEFYHSGNKPNWSDINEKPNLVETSRTITAGTGLTGGGTLAEDRTFDVDFGTTSGTVAEGDDSRIEGAAQKSNNLSDLTNAATARDNLGLGNAATRNVGTSSGQLMEVGAGGWLGAASQGSYISGYPQNSSQNISQIYRREFEDLGVEAYSSSIHFAASDTWGRLRVNYYSPRAWIQGGVAATGTGWTAELYHTGNLPITASRWPSWGEVTGKPSTFTPPTEHGGVGTYAFVARVGIAENGWGTTVAGSTLRLASSATNGVSTNTTALSGTWRVMGNRIKLAHQHTEATLAVRIS